MRPMNLNAVKSRCDSAFSGVAKGFDDAVDLVGGDELLEIIRSAGHTRIPLYEENVDTIRGIIHAKDLLKSMSQPSDTIDLLSIARKPYFVPETKKIDDLLREFQKEKFHMAIVVDEYGGTSGLVTLEDLLEEIVGEIHDEFDVEESLLSRLDGDRFMVDARIDIDDLNEALEVELPSEGFETLAGFIFNHMGKIPEEGEKFAYLGLTFTIEEVSKQRISKVLIHRNKVPEIKDDQETNNEDNTPPI